MQMHLPKSCIEITAPSAVATTQTADFRTVSDEDGRIVGGGVAFFRVVGS
jgi:hypothetical protein